jgi:hypothetical protein
MQANTAPQAGRKLTFSGEEAFISGISLMLFQSPANFFLQVFKRYLPKKSEVGWTAALSGA